MFKTLARNWRQEAWRRIICHGFNWIEWIGRWWKPYFLRAEFKYSDKYLYYCLKRTIFNDIKLKVWKSDAKNSWQNIFQWKKNKNKKTSSVTIFMPCVLSIFNESKRIFNKICQVYTTAILKKCQNSTHSIGNSNIFSLRIIKPLRIYNLNWTITNI